MSTPNPIMEALAAATAEVDAQQQWGQGRTDKATGFLLTFAEQAISQFDALTAQFAALEGRVAALEGRVAALEAPPP